MKIWTWIKSLSWITIAGAVAGAVYLAFNAARASGLQKRAEHSEKIAENLIQDKTKKNIDKAAKLQAGAAKDKKKAVAVKAKAEKQLEKLSETDSTMADIADRFNKRKLRKPTD